jgi:hypothetical protein
MIKRRIPQFAFLILPCPCRMHYYWPIYYIPLGMGIVGVLAQKQELLGHVEAKTLY